MKKVIGVLLVAIAVVLVVQGAGWGFVTAAYRIQGRVTDASGNPVPITSVEYKVARQNTVDGWETATETGFGTTWKTPAQVQTSPSNPGVFDIKIAQKPSSFQYNKIIFRINGSIITDEQAIASVPYALRAGYFELPYAHGANTPGAAFGLENTNTTSNMATSIMAVANRIGVWGLAYRPQGGSIGVLGQNMGQTESPMNAPKLTTIGVYGGSSGVGVMGAGSITFGGATDSYLTTEAAYIGVAGLGQAYGVTGASTNIGVFGAGPNSGVVGEGSGNGVGVFGYHKDNALINGALGSYWQTSANAKVGAGVAGKISQFILLSPVRIAQGALGTWYGEGAYAGAFGKIEDGNIGAGVAGLGGTTAYGGYFSNSSATKSTLYVKNSTAGGNAAAFDGRVGIGTTTPSAKLHVDIDDAEEFPCLYLSGAGSTKGDITWPGGEALQIGQWSGSAYTGRLLIEADGDIVYQKYASQTNNRYAIIGAGGRIYVGDAYTSDRRKKTNLAPITGGLEKIVKLQGYSFNLTENPNGPRQLGLIAQDVEPVIPELVTTDSDSYKVVHYDNLTAVLVEAVKELKAENETLKTRLQALEQKVR